MCVAAEVDKVLRYLLLMVAREKSRLYPLKFLALPFNVLLHPQGYRSVEHSCVRHLLDKPFGLRVCGYRSIPQVLF